ncbi:MAG: hypothetical protein R3F16_17275 [Myxococcota bacterium]
MSIRSRSHGAGRPARARVFRRGLVATALSLASAGCGPSEPPDPLAGERLVLFDAADADRLLERSARLEGTPLGRHSRALLDRARVCETLWGRFSTEDGEGLEGGASDRRDRDEMDALACAPVSEGAGPDPRDPPSDRTMRALALARRGDHSGWLTWPVGDDGQLELLIDIDARGGLEIEGWLVPPTDPGALALLLPDEAPPAASVLTPTATLLHLRMRPAGGLDLARLVPSGGQADRLFGLRGRLLEGALLAGTWELAFVAPPPGAGDTPPRAVIALHHRLATPIEHAVDELLARLEETWPIHHAPHVVTGADGVAREGACFDALPLLPDLAPCWVVTDRALVLAYDAPSLDRALGAPAVAAAPPSGGISAASAIGHGLEVHLDRFARVDRVLLGEPSTGRPSDLYERLSLRLAAAPGGRVAIRASLEARP